MASHHQQSVPPKVHLGAATSGPWHQVDDIQVWGGQPSGPDGNGFPILEACGPREWLTRRRPSALPWEERVANAKAAAALPVLVGALQRAIELAEPLTGQGEDAIWRPANEIWETSVAALRAAGILPDIDSP